jgi:hypothetical protein
LHYSPFGENMAEEANSSKNNHLLAVAEAAKNQSRLTEAATAARKRLRATEPMNEPKKRSFPLHPLIGLCVFLLGIYLPPSHKFIAPFLFFIPGIIAMVKKFRDFGETDGTSARDQKPSPPMPDSIPSLEPYTDRPRDPHDPRRYKPIG